MRQLKLGGLIVLLVLVMGAGNVPLADSASVTIAAAGDIAFGGAPSVAQTETANLIGQIAPTVVLPLGDEQYPKGALSDFNASYDPTWGAYLGITKPVPGNHEYETTNANGYYTYFGSVAGDPAKGYYSYNLGDWHIVALNDNCNFVDCVAENNWLAKDLETDQHLCDLVYRHKPNKGPFWPKLKRKGVDVQLSGHRHIYGRFAVVNGVRRFVAGTGGMGNGALYPSGEPDLQFQVSTYGILQMDLQATSYDWSFRSTNNTVLDSGSTSCHA